MLLESVIRRHWQWRPVSSPLLKGQQRSKHVSTTADSPLQERPGFISDQGLHQLSRNTFEECLWCYNNNNINGIKISFKRHLLRVHYLNKLSSTGCHYRSPINTQCRRRVSAESWDRRYSGIVTFHILCQIQLLLIQNRHLHTQHIPSMWRYSAWHLTSLYMHAPHLTTPPFRPNPSRLLV